MVMNRDFIIFQPRADLYIPILSWVGVRAEVGLYDRLQSSIRMARWRL